jgi:hypothetical protein
MRAASGAHLILLNLIRVTKTLHISILLIYIYFLGIRYTFFQTWQKIYHLLRLLTSLCIKSDRWRMNNQCFIGNDLSFWGKKYDEKWRVDQSRWTEATEYCDRHTATKCSYALNYLSWLPWVHSHLLYLEIFHFRPTDLDYGKVVFVICRTFRNFNKP